MVFKSPSWVPSIPCNIPDTIAVGDFVLDGLHSTRSRDNSSLLVCAISGREYSIQTLSEHVELIARSLSRELGWLPNHGNPGDKVLGIYSFNSIEYLILCWAVHRLNGIVLTIHTSSSAQEIRLHMTRAKCKTVFVCPSLFKSCITVTDALGISQTNIFILNIPGDDSEMNEIDRSFEQLLCSGHSAEPLERLRWEAGQGLKQVAYLAATSGTTGVQKLAKISHFNIIANILQATTFESRFAAGRLDTALLALPLSHTYALEVVHMTLWRGDTSVLHPRFVMEKMLESIGKYRINRLYLVPSIVSALVKNPILFRMYDLSSVTTIVSGAGPFGKNLGDMVLEIKPNWNILPGYGLTESSIIATLTSVHDQMLGSSGSLLPQVELRLLGPHGNEIKVLEKRGEVLLRGPNIISGYFKDPHGSATLIDSDGWLHTGDVGLIRLSPKGNEHLVIVDRMRDMIKVKGLQVAPTDIEAHLLTHPAVKDAAVIGVPDDLAGERPKAFIVRSTGSFADLSETELRAVIKDHVKNGLDELQWLHDRIDFITEIPKNQSGKILKSKLRALEFENDNPAGS